MMGFMVGRVETPTLGASCRPAAPQAWGPTAGAGHWLQGVPQALRAGRLQRPQLALRVCRADRRRAAAAAARRPCAAAERVGAPSEVGRAERHVRLRRLVGCPQARARLLLRAAEAARGALCSAARPEVAAAVGAAATRTLCVRPPPAPRRRRWRPPILEARVGGRSADVRAISIALDGGWRGCGAERQWLRSGRWRTLRGGGASSVAHASVE